MVADIQGSGGYAADAYRYATRPAPVSASEPVNTAPQTRAQPEADAIAPRRSQAAEGVSVAAQDRISASTNAALLKAQEARSEARTPANREDATLASTVTEQRSAETDQRAAAAEARNAVDDTPAPQDTELASRLVENQVSATEAQTPPPIAAESDADRVAAEPVAAQTRTTDRPVVEREDTAGVSTPERAEDEPSDTAPNTQFANRFDRPESGISTRDDGVSRSQTAPPLSEALNDQAREPAPARPEPQPLDTNLDGAVTPDDIARSSVDVRV